MVNKTLLRSLNGPGLVLIATIAVALQTSLFAPLGTFSFLQPDFLLILVMWCGLRRELLEGGVLTLIISEITEIHSASPQGIFLIVYMLVYLIVRGLSKLLVIPNLSSYVTLAMFITAFSKLANLGILHLLGASSHQWRHTLIYLFPGAVVNGLLSLWAFGWLEKFDWVTFKAAKAHQAMEDELQLEGEGF